MPNYEYQCKACYNVFDCVTSIARRDDPQACPECGRDNSQRVFHTSPDMRTSKTSQSFIDGTKRPGMEDMKKVADLQVEQLKHSHKSEQYKQISKEIKERKKIRPKQGKFRLKTD